MTFALCTPSYLASTLEWIFLWTAVLMFLSVDVYDLAAAVPLLTELVRRITHHVTLEGGAAPCYSPSHNI